MIHSSPYTGESYDAAAINNIIKFCKNLFKKKSNKEIIYSVANKPGIKIYPGEIKKSYKYFK